MSNIPKYQRKNAKHYYSEVDGLNMTKIQGSIQWKGVVRLSQLNEDSESLLSEIEWPKKSGNHFFVCASTGLLFDKQSGACWQSSTVTLKIDTLEPMKCTAAGYRKWLSARVSGETLKNKGKPGPKTGSKRVSYDELEEEDATVE